MITMEDLQEAIAECEGQRNPNANTCIKLAAFYTIQKHLFGEAAGSDASGGYSFAAGPAYESETEFGTVVSRMEPADVMSVMDELMSTLSVVNPRLYASVLRKLKN